MPTETDTAPTPDAEVMVPAISPGLRCADAHREIRWLEEVLSFRLTMLYEEPNGDVVYAQLQWGTGAVSEGRWMGVSLADLLTEVAPTGGACGVVFEGASDGKLYAVSAADGKQLWEFDTSKPFDTVNKVSAHGGAISTSGAVVVGGMLFVGSGYGISSGASAGNVLLAFSVE